MTEHECISRRAGWRIGGGSFCEILVESDRGGTPATVCKRLSAEQASHAVYRRALRAEVAALARLDRSGLPWLHSADTEGREPWLRYGYLPGVTVRCRARGEGEATARLIARQLLRHLDYLHRVAGIVHGDIAASNVLVHGSAADCNVSLIDFGNAWPLRNPWRRLPQRAYSAPEQSAGDAWGTPADIFQAGLVVHEVFDGTRPLPPYAGAGRPGHPPGRWQRWFEAVLHPEPERRPNAGVALRLLPAARRWRDTVVARVGLDRRRSLAGIRS